MTEAINFLRASRDTQNIHEFELYFREFQCFPTIRLDRREVNNFVLTLIISR